MQLSRPLNFNHLSEPLERGQRFRPRFAFDEMRLNYDQETGLIHITGINRYRSEFHLTSQEDGKLIKVYVRYPHQNETYAQLTFEHAAIIHWVNSMLPLDLPYIYLDLPTSIALNDFRLLADQIQSLGETNRLFARDLEETIKDICNPSEEQFDLIPELSVDFARWEIQLTFKIDVGKTYVLNNLMTKFYEPIVSQQPVQFGKNTHFLLNKKIFRPFSQALFDFMLKGIQHARQTDYFWDKKTISISSELVDDFIALCQWEDSPLAQQVTALENPITINIYQTQEDAFEARVNPLELFRLFVSPTNQWLFIGEDNQIIYHQALEKDYLVYKIFYAKKQEWTPLTPAQVQQLMQFQDRQQVSFDINFHMGFNEGPKPFELYLDISDENGLELTIPNPDTFPVHVEAIQSSMELNYQASQLEDPTKAFTLTIPNPEMIEKFMINTMPQLVTLGQVYITQALRHLSQPRRLPVRLGVSVSQGTLALDFSADDMDIKELKHILVAYKKKKRFYQLKNGDRIALPFDQLEEINILLNELNLTDIPTRTAKVPAFRLYQVKDLPSEFIQTDFDPTYFNQLKPQSLTISSQYSDILRPYQAQGVQWLLGLRHRGLCGILADDMGLGKSLQTIAYLASLEGDKRPASLIVAPASLLYNWEAEFKKFAPNLSICLVTGSAESRKDLYQHFGKGHHQVYITSYDYLRRDWEAYPDYQFDTLIIDEAHTIKNHNTKASKAVKNIKAQHRIALTGTPIENSLAELWSLFDFLMPGYLYSYPQFSRLFEKPIIRDNNQKKSDRLKQLVSPFILRRLKKEVLTELPEKIEETYYIGLNEEEAKLYQANLLLANQELLAGDPDLKKQSMKILALLTRLRQLALDGRLLYDNLAHPSSKVLATLEIIKTAVQNKEQVLVFSSFVGGLDLIAQALETQKISYTKLTGANSKEDRRQYVQAFQNGDYSVFLISLKAGGTGLNLTAASQVIQLDPWWNLSAQNQASDRAHRMGQDKTVTVYKMIAKGTIEEKILKLQEAKQEISDLFVENSTGSINLLSPDQIRDLFSSDL